MSEQPPQPKDKIMMPIDQRAALRIAFLNLCQQYQQMGEQLKTISELVSPYLNGHQELLPPIPFVTNDPKKAKEN